MKPKILLVKHFDHAIIALLAILLVIAVYSAFVVKETKVDDISRDIQSFDQTIRRQMARSDTPTFETKDYFDEMLARVKNLPVISPYAANRNPFYPEGHKIITEAPLLLSGGQSKEYILPKTRITDVLQSDDEVVDVKFEYSETDNWDNRFTKVSILAKKLDNEKPFNEVEILLGDDADRAYYWEVIVQPSRESYPPNPAINIAFDVRGPYEMTGRESRPPRVLITCFDNDPAILRRGVGVTTGVNIYRKLVDTPDIDYIRLNEMPIVPLASEEQVQDIKKRFYNPEELEAMAAVSSSDFGGGIGGGMSGRTGGAVVPREAGAGGMVGMGGMNDEAERSEGSISFEIGKTYAFVDSNLDGGESYVYKIETISGAEDALPVACESPYVTPSPLLVPSLVEFYVQKILVTGARCSVARPDPQNARQMGWEFDVVPGMRIGGEIRIKRTQAEILAEPGPIYRHIDFTTQNVVIDTLRTRPTIVYTVDLDRNTGQFVYKIKLSKDPRLLYLTPRGSLSIKAVSETSMGMGGSGRTGRSSMGSAAGAGRGGRPGGR